MQTVIMLTIVVWITGAAATQDSSSDLTRKTLIMRGRDYTLNIFYAGGKEIARFKQSPKGIFDQSGTIPDGKITFADDYRHTQGQESYRKGVLNGHQKTYFKDGKLKEDAYYVNGQLQFKKSFYNNGEPRFEIDLLNANREIQSDEIGVGKLYYPNGKLKFEWNFTINSDKGYKKSYNQDGTLRHEEYFDSKGNPLQ